MEILHIEKIANKTEASIGDIVTYQIKITNLISVTVGSTTIPVYIRDVLPPGFKYIKKSTRLDGNKTAEPIGGRTRLFLIGQVPPNATMYLRYQLVVGTGVTFGEYKNLAEAVYAGITPLTALDVAEVIGFAASRPSHVNLDQIVLRPRDQANARRFNRR